MKRKDSTFLKELVEAPSPSGYEQPAAAIVREHMKATADSISTDVLGSVHVKLDGTKKGAPSVMLAGHMDEIGMMVHYIDDKGFISVKPVGGVDAAILPGMRVDIHTSTGAGSVRGVMGRKPIHLIVEEERKTITKLDKLFIDVGMDVDEVKKKVSIGDVVTFGVGFEDFGDGLVVSRALDDKMGVWVAMRVLEEVKKAGGAAGDLYAVATTMEEIGARGAQTAAYALDPDIGIAIDVTHATDYPGIDKTAHGAFELGGGPVIARGPNINPVLFERLTAAAKAAKVDYNVQAEPRGTGTDANKMQVAKEGKIAGLISVPVRYMHTPTEVLSLSDLEGAVKLLTRFVLDLSADIDFTP